MANQTITGNMIQRNDTGANWSVANPILAKGEIGVNTDDYRMKIGNGVTTWNNLPYEDILTTNAFDTLATDTVGVWNVTIPKITSLYDGLIIRIRLLTSYNGTFNTLNVNGLGAKLVWYRINERLTSHVPRYAELSLTYRTNAGSYVYGSTTYTGGWVLQTHYMDGNTWNDMYYSENINLGETIYGYDLLLKGADNKWYPVTKKTSDTATSTTTGNSNIDFLINSDILWYVYGTDCAAGNLSTYLTRITTPSTINYPLYGTFTQYKNVYLVGTIVGGNFRIDSTNYWTHDLPTTENNKVYIYLGYMSTANTMRLSINHPIYWFKDGVVQPYTTRQIVSTSTATTGLTNGHYLYNNNGVIGAAALPTSLPANGGNADTVDNKHASDFAASSHLHTIDHITDIAVGTCSTAIATAAKTLTVTNFVLRTGAIALVKFTYGNTAASPTLNINSTGAKPIFYNGVAVPTDLIVANDLITLMYDGTNWVVNGVLDYGTTTSGLTSGGTGSVGSSNKIARADHTHSLPAYPTIPTSLPANGGNADTVDGKHASDFATASHAHTSSNDIPNLDMSKITSGNLLSSRISEPTYSTGGVSSLSYSKFDILRGDRTAFLPADQIIIEQSIDGGITWTSANFSDSQKRQLFMGSRVTISIPLKNGLRNTDCMTRVTVTGMKYSVPANTAETDKYSYWNSSYVTSNERYFSANDLWTWVSSLSDKIYCKIERATGASSNTWLLDSESYMAGWSGGNHVKMSGSVFGGGTSQTSNYWNWRFTFRTCSNANTFSNTDLSSSYNTSQQAIYHLKISGLNCWSYSNSYMYNEHLYKWDEYQNVIFPNNLKATTFTRSDGIEVSYSNHTHTIDNITDIAVGTCTTAATTAAKTLSVTNFVLRTGAIALVKFASGNTAASATLNINSTGAKSIVYNGVAIPTDLIVDNDLIILMYDGTNWVVNGVLDYGTATSALTSGGTGSAGTSSKISRADHTHTLPAYPTSLPASGGTSEAANYLNINNTETKNVGRLQLFQKSSDATINPDTGWWSTLRTQHPGYANGYWQEVAYSFASDMIKFRRNVNGTTSAWKTLAFTDSSITGNAATASNSDTVDGKHASDFATASHNHTIANISDIGVGTCSTAAATAGKVLTVTNFTLTTNSFVIVKFTYTNTAASPTLNVNGTGAKPIFYNGAVAPTDLIVSNDLMVMMYDGTNWVMSGTMDYATSATTLTGGGTGTTGTLSRVARADHTHTMPTIPTGMPGAGINSAILNSNQNYARGENSLAQGYGASAEGDSASAFGNNTIASGSYSHAEGSETVASSYASHAEGDYTIASGTTSHAEGYSTIASGDYSHAEGSNTTATGKSSHAEGDLNIAIGRGSHAEGVLTKAIGLSMKTDIEDNANVTYTYVSDDSITITHSDGGNKWEEFFDQIKIGAKAILVYYSYSDYYCVELEVKNITTDFPSVTILFACSNKFDCEILLSRIPIWLGWDITHSLEEEGRGAHAEGARTIALMEGAHAEGCVCFALNHNAHAEGHYTTASGHASHAEGYSTETLGEASHAEGSSATASGDYSHAEGYSTKSVRNMFTIDLSNAAAVLQVWKGYRSNIYNSFSVAHGESSHVEGKNCIALVNSHAEGESSEASGTSAHAEGYFTTASGDYSHAQGYFATASGGYSCAEGSFTTASGSYSHAEGSFTTASGSYSHAEGDSTVASGNISHAEGYNTTASGSYSHAEGYNTTASGPYAHAEGYSNIKASTLYDISSTNQGIALNQWKLNQNTSNGFSVASGNYSHVEGYSCFAGSCAHAGGYCTEASGTYSYTEGYLTRAGSSSSHAEGFKCIADYSYTHAEGYNTSANASCSHTQGEGTKANSPNSHISGRYNKTSAAASGPYTYAATNEAFVIGNGTSDTARSNAFRVTFDGKTYGLSAFNSTGADYAEYFEWEDGNPNNEDRVGLFVTLSEDKIKIAQEDDAYILGAISGNASVIGNAHEDGWNEMYIRDEFGRFIYEYVDVPAKYEIIPAITKEHITENGETVLEVIEKEQQIFISPAGTEKRIKLNPNYDPDLEYVPRSERKEWDTVGMLGQLIVKDDGTCIPNSYCKCGKNGLATYSNEGYRVLKRLSENVIVIILK